ncbi:cytochrome d ubiquinol oxidase subunit II [Corynebacterium comes]|uniref:Cytochrome bd-I ubiquinol oxidase subunit 2 n=1 Tax=Corynebacterium comes TaxID=2675218 RepID=A0A6B8W695_9CORY|nr:cytochrome d ubiquinol oxidase subunit II [Corynebacterium comes]QGU05460.1 Cytochrome bd-I ubiquinol oxidase subunit 2 [Corynebacterium comes]
MDLQTLWFIVIAVLFAGYFVLEGFDFGVGMLLPFLGHGEEGARRRDAAVRTIGPVWDGNEVWLITAGAALFAAFPEWYATMFSGFYLPLLLILVALIIRGVALEWRTKVDTAEWRRLSDLGLGIGSWVPALLWGVAFANLMRGVPVDAARQVPSGIEGLLGLLNPFGLLGGLAFVMIFLLHGVTFLGLKTEGALRDRAHRIGRKLALPALTVAGGFAVWLQLMYGRPETWVAFAVLFLFLLGAVTLMLRGRDGLAFAATFLAIVALVALIFGAMFPYLMPTTLADGVSLDIWNSASSDYTLRLLSWVAVFLIPVVLIAQGWTYWVFRRRVRA